MDIRAIILTGAPEESQPSQSGESSQSFAGVPLALLPLLGRPVVQRVADRLRASGVDSISVLRSCTVASPWIEDTRAGNPQCKDVPQEQIWRAAEEEFENLVNAGAELVLLLRLGPYAEIELEPLIQFHLDRRNHVTGVIASDGRIDCFVLSSSRRNDAAFLLRNRLAKMRQPSAPFPSNGYVNRLRTPADLRALAIDSLMQRTSIQPVGKQVRPGIWIGPGARVARNARLVAPCYIGASSKVKAGALVTRGSTIEHHSVVDCGSVVEASTMLPLSYLGTGLDLSHSLVGAKRVFSIKYAAEMEVEDATLVSTLPSTSVVRTLSHAAGLLTFVPLQTLHTLFKRRRLRQSQVDERAASDNFDAAAMARPMARERSLSSSVVAGVRDYGNQ